MLFKHQTKPKKFLRSSGLQLGLMLTISLYFATLSFPSESSEVPKVLSEIISTRSKETGENFVLTRKATAREYLAETSSKRNSKIQSIVINGWTVLYLPGEDMAIIERRARKNESVWKSAPVLSVSDRRPMSFSFWHADIEQVNIVVRISCGVKLYYNSSQRAFLSFVAAKGVPAGDFCRDYMLILAANDIVVRQEGGRFIAKLDEKNMGQRGFSSKFPTDNISTTP